MVIAPVVQTAPAVTVVTIAEAKAHLRVDASDEDALIERLIKAATEYCENVARRSFVTQTLDLTLDAWPAGALWLPRPPVQSVSSITYIDEDGDSDTVSASDYIVDTALGRLMLKRSASWPSATLREIAGVTVRYVAGYGGYAAVPEHFRQAVLLVTADWFENRENMIVGAISNDISFGVMALLSADATFPMVS